MNHAIELRHLRYFLVLSEELNFGKAAKKLFISQPPLSRQIRQLEALLGVRLFERTTQQVTLTPAGEAFVPEVRRTLAQAEIAYKTARAAISEQRTRLMIGYTTVFDSSVIPDISQQITDKYPELCMIMKGKHSIQLVSDLLHHSLDAAFIALHTETHDLQWDLIHEERFAVALPIQHSLAEKTELTADDLRDETFFWFDRAANPGFYDHCETLFHQCQFHPTRLPEPADHHILLGMISEGKGLGLIPESLCNIGRNGVIYRPLTGKLNALSAGIVMARNAETAFPERDAFIDIIRKNVSVLSRI